MDFWQNNTVGYSGRLGLGFRIWGGFPKLGVPTVIENQMEKQMENEMETGFL